jgi:hypothetical protein
MGDLAGHLEPFIPNKSVEDATIKNEHVNILVQRLQHSLKAGARDPNVKVEVTLGLDRGDGCPFRVNFGLNTIPFQEQFEDADASGLSGLR